MEKIVSVDNNYIKKVRKLQQKKYRDAYKLFIVETPHLIKEAINRNLLEVLLTTNVPDFKVNYKLVSSNVLKSITSLKSVPESIGIVRFKNEEQIGNRVLILDDIQDPGNLGTIIRSSVAFNFDTIILSKNTVDLYNPKVINATQGMLFNQNIIKRELIDIIPFLKNNNYKIYGTDVTNGIDLKEIKKIDKIAIIMGNEGQGISKKIKEMVDENIYININKNCESLNVGVATSIILYELSKGDKNEI